MITQKISFFGASITAQKETCYVDYFKEYFSGEVSRIGVGSSHLDDAGFFLLPDALQLNPNILVLDWNSTGMNSFDEFKLRYITNQILESDILPIFAIFPRDDNLLKNRRCEDQVYKLALENKIHIIDVRKHLSELEFSKCTRDGIHTNHYGAKFYANIIHDNLEKIRGKTLDYTSITEQNNHKITSKIINTNDSLDVSSISITYSKEPRSELALLHNAGPWSPVLNVMKNSDLTIHEVSLWDPWCYYQRERFQIILPMYITNKISEKKGILKFDISKKLPNYATSRNSNAKFEDKLVIKPIKLFSFGISVEEISFQY